ncbi:MAG: hypothetical protein K2W97_07115, partial [Chthoniobacterales bacterium]|nr:hypothetical protein [Chthoniobacterales bacterium]
MKHLSPLLLATILVISPWCASATGIMEWRKKQSEPAADTRRLEDQQHCHQVEGEEEENASSRFARGNLASQG